MITSRGAGGGYYVNDNHELVILGRENLTRMTDMGVNFPGSASYLTRTP